MEFKDALVEAMHRNQLRDEHIAILLGVSSGTVAALRKGKRDPRLRYYQALRTQVPHFSNFMDGASA